MTHTPRHERRARSIDALPVPFQESWADLRRTMPSRFFLLDWVTLFRVNDETSFYAGDTSLPADWSLFVVQVDVRTVDGWRPFSLYDARTLAAHRRIA